MADDSETPQIETGSPGPPVMQLVYANTAGIRGGPFDASLEFGYVIPPGEGEEPQVPMWSVRVAMSWEHLRALHLLLGQQLQKYEAQVGPLPDIEKLRIGEASDDR
jgi:hypothetical protein